MRGRFAPGNPGGPGRPPLAAEVAAFEAVRTALTPEVLEGLAAKMAELGLAGDVAAARLCFQVRGVLGRDEPVPVAEQGESLAHVLARPGAAERIDAIMTELFSTGPVPERAHEPRS